MTKELNKRLGITTALSTAYHPQMDGESEQVNQEIKTFLRIYCGNNLGTWSGQLAMAEFAHNQTKHSARNASPFFLIMGYNPVAIPHVTKHSNIPTVQEQLEALKAARSEALATHKLAQQRMIKRSSRGFTPFKVGEKVWLDS